jgi:adenosylmethionine-8-amino-7-oxononanoate aminotransferase
MAELARHPNIGESRGIGLMGALEMVRDKATKESFPGSVAISERIANRCIDNGLICRPLGQAIVLCPPFIITEAEIDRLFGMLETSMKQVFAEVG